MLPHRPNFFSSLGRLQGLLSAALVCVLIGCSQNGPMRASNPDEDGFQQEPAPIPTLPHIIANRNDSHQRMLAHLASIRDRMQEENPYLGDAPTRKRRADVEQTLRQGQATIELWTKLVELGHSELQLGNERAAIKSFRQAVAIGQKLGNKMPQGTAAQTLLSLGLGYMRLGETENCCVQNLPESCLFPIRRSAIHEKPEGSKQAIRAFQDVLAITSPDSKAHKQIKWLLNIAYMTLGEYPNNVPAEYLLSPSLFESDEDVPAFTNVSAQVGLNTFSLSGGAVAEDFDQDGDLDLMVSTWAPTGQLRLFRNSGDGTFTQGTDEAGLAGLYGGLNLIHADFNNDGFTDVLVTRGAWLGPNGAHPNSLLRNNGDGTFTDITFCAGLGEQHFPTQTASWADYDLDGDVDLYIGNEPFANMNDTLTEDVLSNSQLFRNNGDETFSDVTTDAGVTNRRFAKAVVWGDYNNDRWPDLYVSNIDGENRLYHNNGDGTFSDVAAALGLTEPIGSFPTWFWDYDNDGRLDIFVAAYQALTDDLVDFYEGRPVEAERAKLYRNTGDGFVDVADAVQLVQPTLPMGSNFGDLNNDGFLDFYLGTGEPSYQQLMPNVMYLNQAGKRFVDVTTAGGFGNLQKGHAVIFADFDGDGDQDIFEQMGGALLGDRYYDCLYQNPGFNNHWINMELFGVQSNRSAIGTRIRIDVRDEGENRVIHRRVNSGGSFGGNPFSQHIGLGKADVIDRIQIYWPKSDTTQVFENIPVNQHIRIMEGQNTLLTD